MTSQNGRQPLVSNKSDLAASKGSGLWVQVCIGLLVPAGYPRPAGNVWMSSHSAVKPSKLLRLCFANLCVNRRPSPGSYAGGPTFIGAPRALADDKDATRPANVALSGLCQPFRAPHPVCEFIPAFASAGLVTCEENGDSRGGTSEPPDPGQYVGPQ